MIHRSGLELYSPNLLLCGGVPLSENEGYYFFCERTGLPDDTTYLTSK